MYFMKTKTKNSANIFRELIREARGGEVMVNMEDHKDKPFEKPKVNLNNDYCKC